MLIVSGSKSGAEVAIALGDILHPDETTHVLAWLSIGGVHQGSPFADWALNPTVCWLSQLNLGVQGFDLEGALSLQTTRRRSHFARLRFDHPDRELRSLALLEVLLKRLDAATATNSDHAAASPMRKTRTSRPSRLESQAAKRRPL